jgi:CPA2 family monovalent cation:H+ antiporter-2
LPHDTALISTIAVGFAFAFIGGLLASWLRLVPLVGYLLAGVVVGPFTPGFVGDVNLSKQLAEIGVMLLMFGVGMHFSVRDLLAVRGVALPGAILQSVTATALGVATARLWGWTLAAGLVFGLALSVASTVVLLRALEERGELDTANGRIAVGWLIVEDLLTVFVLVLLPALAAFLGEPSGGAVGDATAKSLLMTLALTVGKIAAFVALMLVVGARLLPWLLKRVSRTGSGELFTLAVVAVALGIAFGAAELFGVSFALGAFFAGIVVNQSDYSKQAARELQPLQTAFTVLFFVAVGMMVDPAILVRQPLQVLAVVGIVIIGKSLAAFLIVRVLRYSLQTGLTVSASLAQIGEFSFMLAGLGVSLGMLPPEGLSLVVAGALLSITLNPLAFRVSDAIGRRLEARALAAGEP